MTGPSVWLLLGIPASFEEVRDRVAAGKRAGASDYLDTKIPRSGRGSEIHPDAEWLLRLEERVGRPLSELAEAAADVGVEVRRRATIEDLKEAAQHGEIVIVLSHWKGADLSNNDFRPGFDEALPGRLAPVDHPLAHWMIDELAPRTRFGFWTRPAAPVRDVARRALAASLPSIASPDRHEERPDTTAARRRDLLDAWLDPFLVPGNRMELFDAMHSREAVAAAVAGFAGLIDFTLCRSTYLGDHVAAASGQRIRSVQFLDLQEPVDAALRLKIILAHLARTGISWRNYQVIREMTNVALHEELTHF